MPRTRKGTSRSLRVRSLSFTWDSMVEPLFRDLSFDLEAGWTGVVGPNGSGKTTLLRLAVGELEASSGTIQRPRTAIYCAQRTDDPPEGLEALMAAGDKEAWHWKSLLRLRGDWGTGWSHCSHGERKRAQIAVALWRNADLLAVDEPSNHVDGEARRILGEALAAYRGIGLLVSHDRELLDRLCTRCVHIDPPHCALRRGNYTEGMKQQEVERTTAQHAREEASRELRRLKGEAQKRREEVSRSKKRLSKRGLSTKDRDARGKINKAKLTGKDAVASRRHRQIREQVHRAQRRRSSIGVVKERVMGVQVLGGECHRDRLFSLDPGQIALGPRRLVHPQLSMEPGERIALVGANGTGKSMVVQKIVDALDLPQRRLLYLSQEIEEAEGREVLESIRNLPRKELGECMTLVSRLGSRPHRLLQSESPSPGETRKLLLARGLVLEPWFLILDEGTNHLDLPSIQALEEALKDCCCAMLLVSHDQRFLDALAQRRWRIEREGEDSVLLTQ